ncbi:MAG: hypothetical protein IKR09_01410, partial [Alphaproteobacteria bacterium]|nr:hypothetical protein [Alphaproteobacteria bacterium]
YRSSPYSVVYIRIRPYSFVASCFVGIPLFTILFHGIKFCHSKLGQNFFCPLAKGTPPLLDHPAALCCRAGL